MFLKSLHLNLILRCSHRESTSSDVIGSGIYLMSGCHLLLDIACLCEVATAGDEQKQLSQDESRIQSRI